MIPLLGLMLVMQAPLDTARHWQAGVQVGVEGFAHGRTPWRRGAVTLGGRVGPLTVIGEQALVERFDRRDAATGLDAWLRVSPAMSWYARVQLTPHAEVLPSVDAAIEATRAARHGWELTGGARLMHFAASDVVLASAGLGHYRGPWYVRVRATAAFSGGASGGGGVSLRRYRRTVDDYFDVSANAGTELVTLSPGVVDHRRTGAATLRWRTRLGAQWGGEAGLNWADDEGAPSRAGVSAAVFVRW